MLCYFLFAVLNVFFRDIRENAKTGFVSIFDSLFLFSAGCAPIFGNANTGRLMF